MIFIWAETNWNGDTFFYLNFLTLVELDKNFLTENDSIWFFIC